MQKLGGNTATLVLSNCFSISISIDETSNTVFYQYRGGNDDTIYSSNIEYLEDTDNRTGYANVEDSLFQPAFKTKEGIVYFIGEFVRDKF